MTSSASGPALPTLIVTGGASDGVEVKIESPGVEKTIGSGPSSHVRLTSQNVDALHARVAWDDGGVTLNDEGSAAGTFVNGEKIGTGHVLQDGDRISIGPPGSPGSVRLLVRVPPDLASAVPRPIGIVPAPAPALDLGAAPESSGTGDAFFLDEAPTAMKLGGEENVAAAAARPAAPVPAIIFDEAAAPVASEAPVPSAPAPSAAKGPVRTPRPSSPARPDYMTEIPSIGGDRVREAIDLPPQEPPARAAVARARARAQGFATPNVMRLAIVGAAAAAVTWGAFFAYSHLHTPPPVLSFVTPPKAETGTTVTITGTGFDSSASGNTVRFADAVAAVTSASDTSLAVTVPAIATAATAKEVPVTVQGRGGRSNALFVKIARLPRVTRIDPDVALPGAEITLHGQNLDGGPLAVKIGYERVVPKDVRGDTVRVRVPDIPWTEGQTVPVTVEVGPDTARPMALILGRLPMVTEVAPSSGPIGQRVVVKGRGFDASPSGNKLTIGGDAALVFSASPTELRAAVPAALSGPPAALPVVVEARGATSSGQVTFALSHSVSGLLRLRFYPAPVPQGPPDRHAFVSTELGPVLLLTGKADAPSTAERAGRVADALTALVESSATTPPVFEVREGAAPAVAVSGGAVVVTATAEDADGYAQPGEAGARPTRSTPRQVAAYWAALLQDYVALFGQGQRPSRTAELTPRGKVLVDVYAEAQRRGAAGGVPVATITGLPPSALKSIREMALALPGPGAQTTPGAAVAGRWEGTMADADAERHIEVELQADGPRLAGSLTTKAGELDVRTPLQQVTYEKGQLRFVTAAGGAPRHFRATLEGGTLAGSIYKDATAKDAVGRFSLRYVE